MLLFSCFLLLFVVIVELNEEYDDEQKPNKTKSYTYIYRRTEQSRLKLQL